MKKREKIVQQEFLDDEERVIKRLQSVYGQALKDLTQRSNDLQEQIYRIQEKYNSVEDEKQRKLLQSQERSKIYQKRYQDALKKQVSSILDKMHKEEFKTVQPYLDECYEKSFIGNMYVLHEEGIPLIIPIDQEKVVRAVQLNSKISAGLYSRLGEDVDLLKRRITAEVSRGIATGMSYDQMARQLASRTKIGYNNAVRITRTEGHRIQQQSTKVILVLLAIVAAVTPVLITVGKVITAFGQIHAVAGKLVTGLGKLWGVFAANPVLLIAVALAAAVAAFIHLWNTSESFRNFWINLWNEITSTLSSAWETIKNIITVGIMLIASIISAAVQIITLPWRFIWENCKEYIIEAWNYIKAAVSSALDVISSVISNAWNIIANYLTRILSNIKNKFVSEWNAIKSHVSSAINGIKSSISNGLNGAKSTVTGVLNSIRFAFSSVWDGCKNIVGNAISHIKSLMNFSWSLPRLKLPHFSISGKFSLNPPSVPKLGIEWYKKAMDSGMILNQPTIFGYNAKSNQFLAGGEAGSETVVGTQNLMDMIQEAVNNAGSGNGDSEATRALLEAIFNWMRNGGLYKLLIDVLTNGVEFEFDNREIARLVKKYA